MAFDDLVSDLCGLDGLFRFRRGRRAASTLGAASRPASLLVVAAERPVQRILVQAEHVVDHHPRRELDAACRKRRR